jgi:hypothetical protein
MVRVAPPDVQVWYVPLLYIATSCTVQADASDAIVDALKPDPG